MNVKRVIGIVIFVVGFILILYANHQKNRLAAAHGDISKGTSLFGDNKVTDTVGGVMQNKVSSYNTPVMMLMIGGIVFVVVGAAMAICCRKHRRR